MSWWCAAVASVAVLTACSPPLPQHQRITATASRDCQAAGGRMENRGMVGTAMCVRPYADAGKACTDKSDCTGLCIRTDFNSVEARAHAPATGTCQPDNALFGCFAEVVDGHYKDAWCID